MVNPILYKGSYCDVLRWRISSTLDGLNNGFFYDLAMEPVSQWNPNDHSRKTADADGAVYRDGHYTYSMLWLKVAVGTVNRMQTIVADTFSQSTRELFLTAPWYAIDSPTIRFVDLAGYPDLSNITPNFPAVGRGTIMFDNVRLDLKNVRIIRDPADYT